MHTKRLDLVQEELTEVQQKVASMWKTVRSESDTVVQDDTIKQLQPLSVVIHRSESRCAARWTLRGDIEHGVL